MGLSFIIGFVWGFLKGETLGECVIRGVSFSVIADGQAAAILDEIAQPSTNMDIVK